MNRVTTRILLIVLILALASLACVGGGGDGGITGNGSSWFDATATYGAEQFHIQLTEIARPSP
jgi:hypothetical protein